MITLERDSGGLAWDSHSQEDREAKRLEKRQKLKRKLVPACAPGFCVSWKARQASSPGGGAVGGSDGRLPGSGFCFLPSLLLSVEF